MVEIADVEEDAREAHLKAAKAAAFALLDKGDLIGAGVTMIKLLREREDTAPAEWLVDVARNYIANWDAGSMRNWIRGFR